VVEEEHQTSRSRTNRGHLPVAFEARGDRLGSLA
jgi:hypothetical protein